MAGVLFVIWLPSENYEKLISNRPVKPSVRKNSESTVYEDGFENSKDPINSLQSSLDTYAMSIDSDSLNKKDDLKKRMERTKSADDLEPDQKLLSDDRSRDKGGSMDSDKFKRIMKLQTEQKENEIAIDKFFTKSQEGLILDQNSSMEKVVRETIVQMHIRNASWVRVNNGNSYQVTFSVENGVRCDDTIHMLSEFGVGQKEGSSVAIVPCTVYNSHRRPNEDETSSTQTIKETAWNSFINSVRARMNVAKIVDSVKSDASLTFDFVSLLVVASILAGFGLVEDSTLFLAASMLISPLMGPILAATFGAVIKDHKLQFWGLRNEIIGVFMCIFVGFVFGIGKCGADYLFGGENTLKLTTEILARTNFHSVMVGICIALPSGAAVAISVLGNNFGSLIGVAISASLLPPAVNTGLLWSYSCINMLSQNYTDRFTSFVASKKHSHAHDHAYFEQAYELMLLGCISLCVTLTNVLCVFLMGCLFLKVKEVAPVTEDQRQFWKHDIKIARDYNKTINADEGRKMQEDLAQFHQHESENFKGVGAELLRQSFYPNTHTWSHVTHLHGREKINHTSLRDLDALYTSMAGKHAGSDRHGKHISFSRPSSPNEENQGDTSHTKSITITPTRYSDYPNTSSSAPLEVITEVPRKIETETTLVSFESSPRPSSSRKKKFIVTPAIDPLM